MPTYGVYNLSNDQVELIRQEKARACEGVDIVFAIDCSGSMKKEVSETRPIRRLDYATDILSAIAKPVLEIDDKIDCWSIKDQAGMFIKKPLLKENIGSVPDLKAHLASLRASGGTPFREVLTQVLDRFIGRLKKDSDTKPLNLIIVGDGHDGKVQDIIEKAAGEIHDMTKENPRLKLGIQMILATTDETVVNDFKKFDDAGIYIHNGTSLEVDVISVTTVQQIEDMGGIGTEMCQARILAGGLSAPLDAMLKELQPSTDAN
ncbi:hypothetical protein K4K59_011164 [Colletotrichum sp. SAR11_240]|nr:hypothetical protein K4K59_011164 [Colletotrichum sp. SAR11_240]